jgi:predicted nucleic acid-binding protein
MSVALDTNILAYAEGVDGDAAKSRVARVLQGIAAADIILPVQVLRIL